MTTDYEQGIDWDDTKLNGGAPGAAATDAGISSVDPKKPVRNPPKSDGSHYSHAEVFR
jgi:hypothetical protein